MLKKYLDNALYFEEEGYRLYTRLAKEAKNELSKQLFSSLAEQEKYHIEVIKAFAAKTTIKKVSFDKLEMSIKKVYQGLKKEMLGKDLSQIKGIEEALRMEKEGYALYQKAAVEAETNDDKRFFEELMKMEDDHYAALANLYYYYTESDKWLAEDESKTWNWMNL